MASVNTLLPTVRYFETGNVLTPGQVFNAYLCAYTCAAACTHAMGASTHPWAIREWISETSIVILNGSRPL